MASHESIARSAAEALNEFEERVEARIRAKEAEFDRHMAEMHRVIANDNTSSAAITVTGGGALAYLVLLVAVFIAGASAASLHYSSREVTRLEQRTDMLDAYQQQTLKRLTILEARQ